MVKQAGKVNNSRKKKSSEKGAIDDVATKSGIDDKSEKVDSAKKSSDSEKEKVTPASDAVSKEGKEAGADENSDSNTPSRAKLVERAKTASKKSETEERLEKAAQKFQSALKKVPFSPMKDEKSNSESVDEQGHIYVSFMRRLYAMFADLMLMLILMTVMQPVLDDSYSKARGKLEELDNKFRSGEISEVELESQVRGVLTSTEFVASVGASVATVTLFLAIYYILFWTSKGASPGKMLLKIRVVDADSFKKPSLIQSIIRFLGMIVSGLCLGLGFIWVRFDKKRHRGWHDHMAGTVVIFAEGNKPLTYKKQFRYQAILLLTVIIFYFLMMLMRKVNGG